MSKENKKECENCKKYQEQAFELEVDEELQQEKLNNLWNKYKLLVYIAVILILSATALSQIYKTWQTKVRLTESDKFENAVTYIFSQNPNEAKTILTDLATNGRTGYKHLARMELAGLAARQNDVPTALTEFKTLMNSDAPQSLKNIATLSYIGHQVDSGDTKTLLEQLKPFLSDSKFVGVAAELASVLYLRDNDKSAAIDMLQKATMLPNLSDTIKTRLQSLKQLIESK